MKNFLCVCLFLVVCCFDPLQSQEDLLSLPFYRESDHFVIYCSEEDQPTADLMLELAESKFTKVTTDFGSFPPFRISLCVYPNIDMFHEAIGWKEAPGWAIGFYHTKEQAVQIVSPDHPGPVHSYRNIMHSLLHQITKGVLFHRFGLSAPSWLSVGAAMYEAEQTFLAERLLKAMAQDHSKVRSLEEFMDTKPCEYGKMGGYSLAYAWVEMIVEHWGWERLLQLLENKRPLEEILNQSKEDLQQSFIEFLDQRYGEPVSSAS